MSAAVAARNLAFVATVPLLDGTDMFAPEWVLIRDRRICKVVKRLSAGRGGDGLALFEVVHKNLTEMTRREFVERWQMDE